ncbi:hypothetical protein [Achromobacter insuavis]|uniref:hypothetical protein n=1 Tax=Achromobacter insuavis TaxID=1287735 RepID=UPI001F143A15|nr:hypothetical protein [Achromobacter insuavis]
MSTSIPRPHSVSKKPYKWHRWWFVDVQARTARHISGRIYDFTPGAQDCLVPPLGDMCASRSWQGTLRGGAAGIGNLSHQAASRLCREACTLFDAAAWSACQDCSVNTCGDNYYMVRDAVWDEAHPGHYGMLCLDCLALRLGRQLVGTDFADVSINQTNPRVLALRGLSVPAPG